MVFVGGKFCKVLDTCRDPDYRSGATKTNYYELQRRVERIGGYADGVPTSEAILVRRLEDNQLIFVDPGWVD